VARYFVHLPPDGSSAIFWRRLAGFAGELIQINLNLLAHAVGDDPVGLLPANGTLVSPQNYAFGNNPGESVNLQPFAFTMPGGNSIRPQALPIGPNLQRFLDDPLAGERLDLSLPFYDEDIKLGTNGGGWFRNNNSDNAFHAATDFNTSPTAVFDVCAAAEGRVLAMAGGRIVLTHTTPGGHEFRTVYVHIDLGTVSKAVGDPVRRGEFLGRTDAATSPIHLHFGVAVLGPAFTRGGVSIPSIWYFIDPWGIYDLRANNYLPTSGRIFESPIASVAHTVQWRAQPLFKTIPIARTTDGYRAIARIQVRARRGDNLGGTFPAEHEQFLVWLEGDSEFFLVPLTQASNLATELELLGLLREAFYHGKRVRLEYRYAGDLRYIMAAWVGA
jgi:hypothetical protein